MPIHNFLEFPRRTQILLNNIDTENKLWPTAYLHIASPFVRCYCNLTSELFCLIDAAYIHLMARLDCNASPWQSERDLVCKRVVA